MTNKGVGLVVGMAAALSVWLGLSTAHAQLGAQDLNSVAAEAQKRAEERTPVPRMSDGKPNLTGFWRPSGIGATYSWEKHLGGFGIQSEGPTTIADPPDGILPYQPWALAERERRRRPENAYEENVGKCILPGMPRMMVYNFSIAQTLDKLVMFHETDRAHRVFRFDGRPPLPSAIRLWMGDARGRWEGDTLVVESANFNGEGWGNLGGDVISDAMHIVERYRMVNASTMWWEATMTDPKVYTRPWTMRFPAPHVKTGPEPDSSNFDYEDSCHEGNVDLKHIKNQYDAAHGGKTGAR